MQVTQEGFHFLEELPWLILPIAVLPHLCTGGVVAILRSRQMQDDVMRKNIHAQNPSNYGRAIRVCISGALSPLASTVFDSLFYFYIV
jgi:hypothetical protein